MKNLNKENEEAQKVADDYKNLLQKRENYRMETYGFNWTETGWINIDNGTLPKDWDEQPLEIIVNNGKQFDRVYTYVIYTSIKSLYRLNTRDNERFYVGNEAIGEELFIKNCSSCHRQDNRKLVGPGLAYSTTKYSKQWLIKWTLNSQALIKSGDKDAIKIYNDHNKSVQPSFNLSEKEVLAIYNYIDNYNRKLK